MHVYVLCTLLPTTSPWDFIHRSPPNHIFAKLHIKGNTVVMKQRSVRHEFIAVLAVGHQSLKASRPETFCSCTI